MKDNIKENILHILLEENIKKNNFYVDKENDSVIHLTIGPTTFQIFIHDENEEEDMSYVIESIMGCNFREGILNTYGDSGSIDLIYDILSSDYSYLKTIWKTLEKLENNYGDEFISIVESKYF